MTDQDSRHQECVDGGNGYRMGETVSFSGVVSRLVFRNEASGYTVLDLDGDSGALTLVGTMPYLTAGDNVEGEGRLESHPVYGPQIHVRSVARTVPHGKDRIEKYLASGAIRGIGPATAKKLVAAFGDQTLEVMRQSPERVAAIRGVGLKKARSFQEALDQDRGFQELLLLLLPHGIGPAKILRIHRQLGPKARDLILANPYELSIRVEGIGFLTADAIASAVGIAGDHPARLRGAVMHALHQLLFRDGHTLESEAALIASLADRLGVPGKRLSKAVDELVEGGLLIRLSTLAGQSEKDLPVEGQWALAAQALVAGSLLADAGVGEKEDRPSLDGLIAIRDVTLIEKALARRVRFLSDTGLNPKKAPGWQEAAGLIRSAAKAAGFDPGREQHEALLMALTQSFSVVTGGPGTGKTSMVRLLTQLLRERGEKILLAAPTGRAARRLSEVCGMEALTLHRLLALRASEEEMPDASFWLTAEPLDCDTLIVDECSMIDLFMFAHLLSAVRPGTRLLLIGDADQLPSIGPGQVLRDLLRSGSMAQRRLTEVYRQEAHQLIVSNAHRILRGEQLELDQSLASDFILIDCVDEEAMREGVLKLCRQVLPDYYGLDGLREAQVLSAVRRGAAGVAELNRVLQKLAHGDGFKAIELGQQRFTSGDKVLQTRNNYDLKWRSLADGRPGQGIMNGETGLIESISLSSGRLTVLFEDERIAEIEGEDLNDLDLAYAMTIHKAQGAEYPVEILVIPSGAPSFLTRNLLYTGVTRARERLFILTRRRTLSLMLRNNDANERRGSLTYWLGGAP